jgi:hypothetical protein
MDHDEALVLLAAACKTQIDILERVIASVREHREIETLRQENETLRKTGSGVRKRSN